MRLLYSFAIRLYQLGVYAASPWNEKAKQMTAGWQRLFEKIPTERIGQGKTAWFHAASLGEFEQARPVLERFKKEHPDYQICVTFFSPSGYEIRKNYAEADYICYLPMDTRRNAREFVKLINPTIAFFVKYDFWFNYLNELKKRNVPTFIFSAIFRPNQYFFKWYGGWFRKQLNCYSHLFVQNKESMNLLTNAGINQCSLAGDTRFDRVNSIAQNAKQFPEIESFIDGKPVLMAGSSWGPDENHIKYCIDRYKGELKLILAPHMIGEEHLQIIENLFGKENCVRFTQMNGQSHKEKKVLIIDTMGMLSHMYQYAKVAYIGGAFGHGLHNTLEALTFGKPVCFGPKHQKFQEAKDILALGGGFTYTNPEKLLEQLRTWFDNEEAYKQASQVCLNYVKSNLGATDIILKQATQSIR
ncbi:MAG: 3-deoxy-D-manno-octulosonic acid transferase [Bacteroidales bacterium]|nr:3-deoxy-D-manno-octulosonic acid transferase [Bacteroidales bacterium]